MSKKLKFILLFIIISFVTALLFLNFKKRRAQEDQIIYNRVEQLQELATAKQVYKEIIYSKTVKDILWLPLAEKEFLISLDYIVTAGIDLEKGYNIEHKTGKVIITLPKGEILSIDAVDSSINQYFIKERLTSINRDDFFAPINDSKKRILEKDEIEALLILCEKNAADILISLLKVSGIEARVEFKEIQYGENM